MSNTVFPREYDKYPLWPFAVRLANALRPLLAMDRVPNEIRKEICREFQFCESTYYNYLEKFRDRPVPSAPLPKKPGPDEGYTRLPEYNEQLLLRLIDKEYLNRQNLSIKAAHRRIIAHFEEQNLKAPSYELMWRRIQKLKRSEKLTKRRGHKEANSKNAPATQHYRANRPMEVVQFDHTLADIILVDSLNGEELGRPVITVGVDLYTRMVVGIHLDFFGPSVENVAEALVNTCFDKQPFLDRHGVEGTWHTLGLPEGFHSDLGKDFRAKSIAFGLAEHGIANLHRARGQTHHGGHVERIIGTLMKKVHELPGTTFSNIIQKGNYDSVGKAALTLTQFENLLVNHIVNFYHKTIHSELGIPPLEKYRRALKDGFQPRLPVKNIDDFRIDFLRRFPKKVRREGLEHERIFYWGEIVKSWYDNNVSKVQIIPFQHDITKILAIGPDGENHTVYSKDLRLPKISRAEYRRYRRILNAKNAHYKMTNAEIARQVCLEHNIVLNAKKTTRLARRSRETFARAEENKVEHSRAVRPLSNDQVRLENLVEGQKSNDDFSLKNFNHKGVEHE